MLGELTMGFKCKFIQPTDKRLWLFMNQAWCRSEEAPLDSSDDDLESILHPTLELYRHTLMRGANVGSFLFILLGTPVLFYKGIRKPAELLGRLVRVNTYGVLIGMGLSAVLTYARVRDQTDEQMFDRAYRLRHNKGQVLMDKMTYAGILTGGLAGVAARPSAWVGAGLQGACLGVGLSVFAQVLTKPLFISEEKSN